MHKYSEVIGLPVICAESGKKFANVSDVIFCPKKREVKAFIIKKRDVEIKKRAIKLEDILSLGRDALIVKSQSCPVDFKKLEKTDDYKEKAVLNGMRIYSKTGDDLGIVKDILFDTKHGVIEGFEISDGLLQDILKGRQIIPIIGKVEFSEESILVEKEAVEEMLASGGGIEKKFFG